MIFNTNKKKFVFINCSKPRLMHGIRFLLWLLFLYVRDTPFHGRTLKLAIKTEDYKLGKILHVKFTNQSWLLKGSKDREEKKCCTMHISKARFETVDITLDIKLERTYFQNETNLEWLKELLKVGDKLEHRKSNNYIKDTNLKLCGVYLSSLDKSFTEHTQPTHIKFN